MALTILRSEPIHSNHTKEGASLIRLLMGRVFCGVLAVLVSAGVCMAATGSDVPASGKRTNADYGKVPLSFEANHGQTDPRVQYFSRGQGYGLFLTSGEAVLELEKLPAGMKKPVGKDGTPAAQPAPETSVLRMKLMGANSDAPVAAQDRLPGTVNYFRGNDPKQWATEVPTYQRVSYTGVYPGIDLVYYGNQRKLEYDFVVAPGADPEKIALNFTGATPKIDSQGNLVLASEAGETCFHKPVVYQMSGDSKMSVAGAYQLAGNNVRFALGTYDHRKPLVIDPVLTYGTFLGGSLDDRGFAIAADAAGNAYIAGDTVSLNFPLVNAFQSTNHNVSNGWVVFVSKLNPEGTALIYSTFLGGIYDSHALGLVIDASGNAYIGGYTAAGDYPVTAGAFQPICGSNFNSGLTPPARTDGCGPSAGTSGFLTKLSPTGNSLVYSTFLSGNNFNQITAIAINTAGEAYVTGNTNASCGPGPYYPAPFGEHSFDCFPTTPGALQAEVNGAFIPGGNGFAFISKFSADGSQLLYSSLFAAPKGTSPSGGGLNNSTNAIAVDTAGNAYITGTGGYGLPTTAGAFYVPPANSSTVLPPYPAFVAKFNPGLSGSASLVYSTFLGSAVQTANATNYRNVGTGIAVDASGSAIVTGYTQNACGYPTTAGAYLPSSPTSGNGSVGCADGFVSKLTPDGTGLVWSTMLGSGTNPSTSNTVLNGLALGSNGNVYVTGVVQGATFPLVNPIRTAASGGSIIAELDPSGSKLLFSTYLGSFGTAGYGGTDVATGVATDPDGNMYVTGRMDGNTLTIPTTPGALQTTYQGGSYDAFVLKIAPTATSTTSLSLSSASVNSGQPVTLTATVKGPSGSSTPTGTVTFLSGSGTLGTGTLDASGNTTYSTSSLSATTYTLTAQYGGDSSFSTSTSTPQTLTVNPIGTSTTLTVAPNPALTGQSVTFTAHVTPASGTAIPTGTVTFKNGATTLSAIAVDATGKATYSTASLAAATYPITAMYSGDGNNASSASSAVSLVVSAPVVITTTTTLSASANSVAPGTTVTFTAKVLPASGSVAPTGTVTFKEGATTLGAGALNASGIATFATSTLAVGAHSITASYGGDAGNAASVSAAVSVTVAAATAADFSLTLTPTNATVNNGSATTVTVTVTPINGFNAATSLSCVNLPTYASCSFKPASVTPNGAPATSTLTIATNGIAVAGFVPPLNPSESANSMTPIMPMLAGSGISLILVSWMGFRSRGLRKQWMRYLGLLLFCATIVGGVVGCGSSSKNTPPGTYSVTVKGTSGSLTHSATYSVTVK